jgi:hypothetical protein
MNSRSARILTVSVIMTSFAVRAQGDDAADRGVPRIDPDFSRDVRDWWATHPMNPKAQGFLKTIDSPEPVISLRSGESIGGAVDRLPAAGGTIQLDPGTYDPFTIMGRNNIHILGPRDGEAVITGHSYLSVCKEAMDYVQFDRLVSHFDSHKYRDKRVWDLYRNPPRNFYLRDLVFDGRNETEVDFPGVGIQGPGGALGLKGVRDVVVEDCTFRNYLDSKGGLQHGGLAWGHYGLTNVWFRGCRFEGTARYAVYWDGAHASGLVGCTVDGAGCKDGGFLFLTNHDFTDDRNEDGKIDPREEKCAKFLVLDGNTFHGAFSAPMRITGQNCLVTGNVAKATMLELLGVYPVGEIAHRTWGPGEIQIRVVGNSVGTCARAVVNIFIPTEEKLREVQRFPTEVQYTVEGNTVAKSPELVRYTVQKKP